MDSNLCFLQSLKGFHNHTFLSPSYYHHLNHLHMPSFNKNSPGLPRYSSGWESTCQGRGHEFDPWSRKILHPIEQLNPCATTIEICVRRAGPEKAMALHSSTLAWIIPWTEEPGGLQSMGLLRVGHDWATSLSLFTFMHWRRKWQPTPVFLPGESQGQRSLVGCRLWSHTESDMTKAT